MGWSIPLLPKATFAASVPLAVGMDVVRHRACAVLGALAMIELPATPNALHFVWQTGGRRRSNDPIVLCDEIVLSADAGRLHCRASLGQMRGGTILVHATACLFLGMDLLVVMVRHMAKHSTGPGSGVSITRTSLAPWIIVGWVGVTVLLLALAWLAARRLGAFLDHCASVH